MAIERDRERKQNEKEENDKKWVKKIDWKMKTMLKNQPNLRMMVRIIGTAKND